MLQLKKIVSIIGISVILLINNSSVLSNSSQPAGALSNRKLEKLYTSSESHATGQALRWLIQEDVFINQLAEDTWGYLHSDWATDNHLPWSWRSTSISGGDYANTAEIGFYALSWLAAYDMQETWSPNWDTTESEVTAVLDQLRTWQTDSLGEDSYNNSVFYQWYWINSSPPGVGGGIGDNLVPSIDNAWLAASLITIREYAEANGRPTLAQKANAILTDMDFSLWYHNDTHLFSWGDIEDPQAGNPADYYSNENRIINFVARALGDLDENEFALSLAALEQSSGIYDGITVEKIAYDGSYFTYAGPALFIREMLTSYGVATINPATQAQIQYASNSGYQAWGLSDSYDIEGGSYIQQGAPPVAMTGSPETRSGLVSPHASALALITSYDTNALANLQFIADTYDCAYDDMYGFLDSVITNESSVNNGKCSYRFSALNQEWIFLSLSNYLNGFVWEYFYKDEGVLAAHTEMYNPTFGDVPASHPYWQYIEVLYANGLTNGCSTTELLYCPTMIMNRAQVAKFFMTVEFGGSYLPPSDTPLVFKDSWKINPWAKLWANDMYEKGLTNGCGTSPLRYCPDSQVIREQVAKFGLSIKYGNAYIPPTATGTVFADLTDVDYWATAWAEQAYADGLVPACGTAGGKPMFCPYGKVDRGFAAFVIVTATGLLGP